MGRDAWTACFALDVFYLIQREHDTVRMFVAQKDTVNLKNPKPPEPNILRFSLLFQARLLTGLHLMPPGA